MRLIAQVLIRFMKLKSESLRVDVYRDDEYASSYDRSS